MDGITSSVKMVPRNMPETTMRPMELRAAAPAPLTSVSGKWPATVATLALRYKVSPANVAEWNKVKVAAAFKAGQAVVVFLPVQALAATKGTFKPKAKPPLAKAKTGKPVQLARQ